MSQVKMNPKFFQANGSSTFALATKGEASVKSASVNGQTNN